MNKNINLKFRLKSMIQYQIYGKFANISTVHLYRHTYMKTWFILLRPVAMILYRKWNNENKK